MGRTGAYETVAAQVAELAKDAPGFVAALASTAALLKQTFDHYFWVGFYLRADDGTLVVGPYQGPLACMHIEKGRGVCGAVAESGEPIIVPDVHAFPDHIACDSRSRSEVVVPLMHKGRVRAVLDVDAETLDAFDESDCNGLVTIAALLSAL
ncbi:MAG: GAF domain-containing protein [Planctomycetota bacterium]